MPFVQRTSAGAITGVYARLQPGIAEEFLPADNGEVVAYLAPKPPIDLSNIDSLEKTIKATNLNYRNYCNALKLEIRGLVVKLVQKGTITAAEANALLVYDGSNPDDTKSVPDLKADFSATYTGIP